MGDTTGNRITGAWMYKTPNEQTTRVSELAEARSYREQFSDSSRKLRNEISGIRLLFGDAVARQLASTLEVLEDRASDMAISYDRAVAELEVAQRARLEEMHRLHQVIEERNEKLEMCSAVLAKRYRRSNRPMPDWLTTIRADFAIDAACEAEPF